MSVGWERGFGLGQRCGRMNGEVKPGIQSTELGVAAIFSGFLSMHQQLGVDMNEATLDALTTVVSVYIGGRVLLKIASVLADGLGSRNKEVDGDS